jgi:hypothetical protein
MAQLIPSTAHTKPSDRVLRQLRIPFVRRATLHRGEEEEEEVFVIDIGLSGVFVERARALDRGERVSICFAWPGSEKPFEARCRVAWWHPEGSPLSSKSLPPGGGLEFVEMSEAGESRVRALLLRNWPESERQGDDPTAG